MEWREGIDEEGIRAKEKGLRMCEETCRSEKDKRHFQGWDEGKREFSRFEKGELGELEVKTMKHHTPKVCITFLITMTFFLNSEQVILVPYCCLSRVLSNYVMKVSIGTFSYKIHAPTSRRVLRRVQNTATCNFPTPREYLIHQYRSKCFEKPHTNFGVLLSMYAWFMTVELCCVDLVTLMLVHASSKKMCL